MSRRTLSLKPRPKKSDEAHDQIVEALAASSPAGLFGLKGSDSVPVQEERGLE